MSNIERVIDGDTFITQDERVRVSNIDTAESKHRDEARNTKEGDIAYEFAKDVLPEGEPIITHDYGRDHFGRKVSSATRSINGVNVDYGLVALDQGMSTYFVEYGEHPDPLKHDAYKEYYSKYTPYQFGATEEPLTREQFDEMTAKQELFRKTYNTFKEGETTQEEFDRVTADLYGNPEMVMRYRHQLSNWNRPIEQENTSTIRSAIRIAMEEDPALKEQYNRAVRSSHLMVDPIPEEEPSFLNKLFATYSMQLSVSNLADTELLWASRRLGEDAEIPEEELLRGVPENFHTAVLEEATKYNDQAALVLRDQLIEDTENNRIFDNLERYAQFGYGALATITDPLAIAAAIPIGRGGQAVMTGVKAWTRNRAIRNTALMATWATGNALEGAAVNTPRLSGDHTYTAKDLQLDMLMDASFGLGLGAAVEYAVKPAFKRFVTDARESRKVEQEQIQQIVENKDKPTEAATPELAEVKEEANVAEAESKAKETVAQLTGTKFTPWEAITKVSQEGFEAARIALENVFPQNTPLRKLINSQFGLNLRNLTPEERSIANELNADILHLVSAFPDGKVPKNIEKSIAAVAFRQRTFSRKNALADILKGETTSQVDDLKGYLKALRNHTELWKVSEEANRVGFNENIPVKIKDFLKEHVGWITRQGHETTEDIISLSKTIPKEMSYLKDMVELNKLAIEKNDDEFTHLVEELNGLVTTRIEQRRLGDFRKYIDAAQSWGKTVEMSPTEVAARLKKEGLTPRTPAYSKRMQELRQHGRVEVSEDVRAIGKGKEITVGKEFEEVDPEATEYYLVEDAKQELAKLQKKSKPTEDDVARSKELLNLIDKSKETKEIELVKDFLDQDLLPRSYTRIKRQKAYANPTVETLREFKTRLNQDILRKLGVKTIKGKTENVAQQQRLEKVKSALIKDKSKVIDRMIKAGEWQNIEDVIRASHTIVEKQKQVVTHKMYKPVGNETTSKLLDEIIAKEDAIRDKQKTYRDLGQPEEHPIIGEIRGLHNDLHKLETRLTEAYSKIPSKGTESKVDTPLTEDELDILADKNSGETTTKVPDDEYKTIQNKANKAYEKMVEDSANGVSTRLADFVRTGEKKAFELARKPRGILDVAGTKAAKITEDLGTKFQNGKLTSLEYIGSRIPEIGKGYGGDIRRKETGGIIRDAVHKESIMQVAPPYVKAIDDYAKSKGLGVIRRLYAQQLAGADNKIVQQFNKDVFLIQEYRRQGKELPNNLHESVIKFVDDWDKYMDYNHGKLVEAKIGGFTKERKVKHYIPHIWQLNKLLSAIKKHGEHKVEELFTRAYQSSSTNNINPTSPDKARELAKRQIQWIKDQGENPTDQFIPVADSRAKQRLDLDTTMEFEGLSILDLLDNEVISVANKYSNRVAGWVGLSESTDGMLTSQLDIDSLKKNLIQEGKDKNIGTKTYEQYYDDLIDLMFGRPTRGGLNQELRQLKDLTALTRMGGLGTAQAIETGQVITRSVLNTFSSEPVVRKVMKMARVKEGEEAELIREIQSISNITDDFEWIDRQSVHLDQAELEKINKARQLSLWIADKATFGKHKAPASRLLGKTTGYNAVRRFQSRITQASFAVDVAKHFKDKSGKMGNARMADVGLTDAYGVDLELQEVFDNLVEYGADGLLKKLNVDKWPESARKKFQYALLRDEAQQIQRTHVGELPPWMNKPLMALAFQFRQMPIVATNKQMSRSLAFADKEAVTATMLNAAMSGLVRYGKFVGLGIGVTAITGREWQDPNEEQMQVDKYITQFGIFPDARDLVLDAYSAGTTGKTSDIERLLGQVPVMGLMKDYYDSGFGDKREQIDAAQGLVPLGNTAYGDMIHTWIQEEFGD